MNPLLDKQFLKDLTLTQQKETYVKIISYDNKGRPQAQLEGCVIGGSINIDGASAARRSCSLTIQTSKNNQDSIYFDLYWSYSTTFRVFIGQKNTINKLGFN